MDFMTARQAADKWGISQRRVAVLCAENRIAEATRLGNMWVIPVDAEKPIDARCSRYNNSDEKSIKPFLKWAGGKGQLLKEIEKNYPFDDKKIIKYAEPFVGGGAVLFDILNRFDLKEVYISDVNDELINAYNVIRDDVDILINFLFEMQEKYLPLNMDERKKYYFSKRTRFNELKVCLEKSNSIERASLLIFLNKTCFNGLYRVNKKGLFNVPMGSYKAPLICDENNLIKVSEKLKNVEIVCGDYKKSAEFIDEYTFVYFDPPYRPLTETSSFTSYTDNLFNDDMQIELAKFVDEMNDKKAKILLSNSDPKNVDVDDNFFDELYSKYNIKRIEANRMINCKGQSRGKIKELLISNY